MNQPFFSVIIPNYNKVDLIGDTLASVFQQTYNHFEVIVVDDGSQDESLTVLNKITDKRLSIIAQTNAGVSAARNAGIKQAKGDWIAFLDADDWWHPDYLKTLQALISKHPDAQYLTTSFYDKPDSPDWTPTPWSITPDLTQVEIINDLPTRWMQGMLFFTSSICITTALLRAESEPFIEGIRNGEDLDLWFRMGEKTPIYFLNSPLVAYRTEQNQSLSQIANQLEEPFQTQSMQQRLDQHLIPTALIEACRLFIAHEKLTRARFAILAHRRSLALKLNLKATAAIKQKRFWMTLIMICFLPKKFVANWINKTAGRQNLENHQP